MYPPQHVCRQLYDFDPNLRLCWIGEDFEGTGEGCFGLVEIRPQARVEDSQGKRKTIEPWFPYDIAAAGPVYNRQGGITRDYDALTQAPVLICTISPQWGMHTRDVYGTRLLSILRIARKTQAEHVAQKRTELERRGKEHAEMARGIAEEFADGIMHARKHHAGERITMARKHYKEWAKEQARKKAFQRRNRIGLDKVYLRNAGLL